MSTGPYDENLRMVIFLLIVGGLNALRYSIGRARWQSILWTRRRDGAVGRGDGGPVFC